MKKILNLLISLFRSIKVFNDKIEYKNESGQYHRTDGPAIEYNDGTKEWWINGKLHSEDGPAVEYNSGSKGWWINGKCHREDGPAIENIYYKQWYINDKKHREDGPAVEFSNGSKSWYLNGIYIHKEDFEKEIIKLKLKRLVNL